MEELDLKDLLITMWEKKIVIIVITSIFLVIGAIYSFFFITPKYAAYTQLLLLGNTTVESQEDETSTSNKITQADLTMNKSLINTYSKLIQTKLVLGEVLDNLKANPQVSVPESFNENSIKNNMKVAVVPSTDIIEITVQNTDPVLAKAIVEELSAAFMEKIDEAYGINNVYVVEKPEINYAPVNINHAKDILVFTFIGFVISCMYVFIMEMFNVKVKTVSDIEKLTNIPVIAEISLVYNKKGDM